MVQTNSFGTGASEADTPANNRQSGHSRVTEALRQRIQNGDWAPGTAIPSRRHLATEYKVSPATMERAIVPLLADGTLRADDRRGTFVSETVAVARPQIVQSLPPRVASKPEMSVQLGYQLGPIAIVASLYAPDSPNLGQNDQWIREIVGAMEHELAEHGRHTVFINRVPRHALEPVSLKESLEQALVDKSISGVAIISFDLHSEQVEKAYDLLAKHRIPIVSVVAEPLLCPVSHVLMDNQWAGFQAAQYLIERGYRTMTVMLPEQAVWGEERLKGIQTAMARAGLAENVRILRGEDHTWDFNSDPWEMPERTVNRAFESGWKPDGPIICISDVAAIIMMNALTERGYDVGSEIPVIGFDDHELARDAGLTTMRPPLRAMGTEAARLLLAAQESRSNGCQVRLWPKLIPRKSTSAKPSIQNATCE